MNQMLITAQRMRWLILITIIGLLAFGYFLQYVEGLAPCPLCITQRFFFFLCGLTALIAIIHHPAQLMTRVYAIFGASFALAGSGFAGRQLYLQSLPADQAPACGPSIEFIFDTFSMSEALSILLRGDGNCAEVAWQFLGISIPGWAAISFIGLAIAWLIQLRNSDAEHNITK